MTTKPIPWKKLEACAECGVGAGVRCHTEDDDLAEEPCAGRQLRAGAVVGPEDVIAVETTRVTDKDALDRIAEAMKAGFPDGLKASVALLEEVGRFVRLSGRAVPEQR
jgi:hypothetical protein